MWGSEAVARYRLAFHAAVKILNSYGVFASLSDAYTMLLPSGANSGNAVKPPNFVTCSPPGPTG